MPEPHRLAVAIALLGAAINSTGGILVRNTEAAGEWQIVFWRGLALGVSISLFMWLRDRPGFLSDIRRIGRQTVLGGLFYGGALTGYVLALTNTTVANADFMMSAIPIFTALFAWLVLGERVSTRTAVAIAAAVAGVALMLGDGISAGTLFGNAMALAASLCFACFVIVLRKGHTVNMLPAVVIGAFFAAMAAAVMTGGNFHLSARDLTICLFWGGVTSSVALFLIVTASRSLSGAELTLLILVEFILGPTWVWVFLGERPSALTLAGGAIVLVAVGGHALASLRGHRRSTGPLA